MIKATLSSANRLVWWSRVAMATVLLTRDLILPSFLFPCSPS